MVSDPRERNGKEQFPPRPSLQRCPVTGGTPRDADPVSAADIAITAGGRVLGRPGWAVSGRPSGCQYWRVGGAVCG